MNDDAAVNSDAGKRKKDRSPAYPFINLETAVRRAKEFYDKERRNAAAVIVAAKGWGYKEKSSGGIQTVAALKSFGLLTDTGSSKSRTVRLSDLGLRIVMDERQDSLERIGLLKEAALTPRIHKTLWERYGTAIPSDDNLRYTLRMDFKFNDNVVGDFIREYRDTITFAKLSESDIVVSEGTDGDGRDPYKPKIGDFVQWESGGALQFPEPRRVRGFSDDGEYAFVVGSETGLRVSELIQQKAPVGFQQAALSEHKTPPSPNNMKEDVFSLANGRVVIQWPAQLTAENIQDIKDWLKIVERKITRSVIGDDAK